MNKRLITLISALTLGAALSAVAGPDWQVIEQARKAKATQTAKGADTKACPPAAPVLPLDHGPRAQTTLYLNQMRKDQYETQVRACR